MKRRKPDILMVLAILLGLSVLVTGFTQEIKRDTPPAQISAR